MNASQFMDKQIMDLASSTNAQTQSKDFIDLMKHPEEDHCGGRNGGGGRGDEIDGLRAEEIVPSYDFQPIRPISTGLSSPKSLSFDGESSARAWGSVDSKTNTNVPIRNYSSLDSFEPGKVILEKDQHADTASIVSEIDQTIKKHVDNLLHALDTVSARLTQLESRTRNLENSVDDLKVAAGNNYGSTDGKMRQLENMLREVQNGVQVIKDKQEIMEGQFQIPKLQISKPDHPQETHNAAHVDSVQPPPPCLPQQSHTLQQPPPPASAPFQQPVTSLPPTMAPPSSAPFQQSVTSLPPTMTPPPLPSQQQILPPSVPIPNKFPQLPNPSVPQREPYFPPPPGQPHEASNQQYQLPPTQQPLPPAAQQHQQYPPPHQAPYSQPTHPPQHPSQIQPPPGNHPEEPPYMHYPPPSFRQPPPSQPPPSQPPPSQPPQGGVPPSQQLYGSPAHVYEPPPVRSSLGFSSDPYPYGGSSTQYGSNSPVKPHQHSQNSSGGGYPQLPTARVLPQALPTASGVNSGSGSSGTGNRLPVDDVVDKVASMGFPRDQVRATVRKLTESGQSVDLNMVLDKLMNDSDVQPPRGWLGR